MNMTVPTVGRIFLESVVTIAISPLGVAAEIPPTPFPQSSILGTGEVQAEERVLASWRISGEFGVTAGHQPPAGIQLGSEDLPLVQGALSLEGTQWSAAVANNAAQKARVAFTVEQLNEQRAIVKRDSYSARLSPGEAAQRRGTLRPDVTEVLVRLREFEPD